MYKIYELQNEKSNVLVNVKKIIDYLTNPCSQYKTHLQRVSTHNEVPMWILKISFTEKQLATYTKQSLEALINNYNQGDFMLQIEENILDLTNQMKEKLGNILFEDIGTFLNKRVKQKQNDSKSALLPSSEPYKYTPFISLLKKFGFSADVVWKYQRFYNKYAIMYLFHRYTTKTETDLDTECGEVLYDFLFDKSISITQRIVDKMEETFGLLCAGGGCSKLAICMVPPLLQWDVSDYDGLEHVHIV
jgi:hypothetical protein